MADILAELNRPWISRSFAKFLKYLLKKFNSFTKAKALQGKVVVAAKAVQNAKEYQYCRVLTIEKYGHDAIKCKLCDSEGTYCDAIVSKIALEKYEQDFKNIVHFGELQYCIAEVLIDTFEWQLGSSTVLLHISCFSYMCDTREQQQAINNIDKGRLERKYLRDICNVYYQKHIQRVIGMINKKIKRENRSAIEKGAPSISVSSPNDGFVEFSNKSNQSLTEESQQGFENLVTPIRCASSTVETICLNPCQSTRETSKQFFSSTQKSPFFVCNTDQKLWRYFRSKRNKLGNLKSKFFTKMNGRLFLEEGITKKMVDVSEATKAIADWLPGNAIGSNENETGCDGLTLRLKKVHELNEKASFGVNEGKLLNAANRVTKAVPKGTGNNFCSNLESSKFIGATGEDTKGNCKELGQPSMNFNMGGNATESFCIGCTTSVAEMTKFEPVIKTLYGSESESSSSICTLKFSDILKGLYNTPKEHNSESDTFLEMSPISLDAFHNEFIENIQRQCYPSLSNKCGKQLLQYLAHSPIEFLRWTISLEGPYLLCVEDFVNDIFNNNISVCLGCQKTHDIIR